MKRRDFLKRSVASGLLLNSSEASGSKNENTTSPIGVSPASSNRPNILLILTDDQAYWDMGAYGNSTIETPVMDQLAREGVRCTHFYVSPLCTPSRSSLMTGRHCDRTGAYDTDGGYTALHPDEVTIADVLRGQGYRTGLIGKWHLGGYMRYHPNARGFDDFFGFWQDGIMHRCFDPDQELFSNKDPVEASGYCTDIFTDRAIDFIGQNKQQPFFLYLAYNSSHAPFEVPDRYIDKYVRKGLPLTDARNYGTLDSTDENLGRLLKAVDDLGLRDQTIVIFLSDNGGSSRHFTAGLRGTKATVYEGGLRVPFVARWPGKFPAGATVDAMAQHIDVFPTLCEIAGSPLPGGRTIDGRSILSLLTQGSGESPHRYTYHQRIRVGPALEVPTPEQAKECRYEDQGPWPNWAIRDAAGHKLVATTVGKPPSLQFELFNLNVDPGEAHNLAPEFPGQVRALKAEFTRWYAEVTAGQDFQQPPIQVGRDDENPVLLDLNYRNAAKNKLKISSRHFNRNTIDNWNENGDSISWPLEVVRAGRYVVTLSYGCHRRDAGSKLLVRVGDSQLQHTTQPTPGRNVYRRFDVGTLDLAKGNAAFEMSAISIPGRELFALHRIWLRRQVV